MKTKAVRIRRWLAAAPITAILVTALCGGIVLSTGGIPWYAGISVAAALVIDQAMWLFWVHGQWEYVTRQMTDPVIRFDTGFKDNPDDRLDARALRWWRI